MLNLSFFRCKLPDGLIVGFEFCVFGVFETVLALSHIVSGKDIWEFGNGNGNG